MLSPGLLCAAAELARDKQRECYIPDGGATLDVLDKLAEIGLGVIAHTAFVEVLLFGFAPLPRNDNAINQGLAGRKVDQQAVFDLAGVRGGLWCVIRVALDSDLRGG